jgi:hypothetical protein
MSWASPWPWSHGLRRWTTRRSCQPVS